MNKMNETLTKIRHLAWKAIITDDESVKRIALGDIYDAIASLMPVDHGVYRTPKHIVDFVERVQEKQKETQEAQGYARFLRVADGVQLVRFAGNGETKLVARRVGKHGNPNTIFEIVVDKAEKVARVLRDGRDLFVVAGSECQNVSMIEKMAVSSLHRFFSNNRDRNVSTTLMRKRKRARKAAEKAAAEVSGSTVESAPVTVGCPELRMMKQLPSGFDGVEPSAEELENA